MEALKLRLELRDIRAAHDRLLRYLHYQTNEQNIILLRAPPSRNCRKFRTHTRNLIPCYGKARERGINYAYQNAN
jgi:hypothetical protein